MVQDAANKNAREIVEKNGLKKTVHLDKNDLRVISPHNS
jgi:hypothetical protein